MKKKYNIVIAGTELGIISDEDKASVERSAKLLDSEIMSTIVQNQKCTKLEAAILCALTHLDGELKAKARIEELLSEKEEQKNEK